VAALDQGALGQMIGLKGSRPGWLNVFFFLNPLFFSFLCSQWGFLAARVHKNA